MSSLYNSCSLIGVGPQLMHYRMFSKITMMQKEDVKKLQSTSLVDSRPSSVNNFGLKS